MLQISKLLQRFNTISVASTAKRATIASILKDVTNGVVDEKNIRTQSKMVTIQTNPLIKNVITIKKQEILRRLREKGLDIEDIR